MKHDTEDMNAKLRSEMRDYAWKYFALHADQRIKTFNFFLVLCALILGGAITFLRDVDAYGSAAVAALSLSFTSFIFWRLDIRNRQLVECAEEALRYLESQESLPNQGDEPNPLKLFLHERYHRASLRQQRVLRIIPRHWSYSTCFNAVFFIFGAASAIWGAFLLVCH